MINLKEQYGDRYRVTYEESYHAERSKHTVEDPWLMIIPCKYGHICPWTETELAACTDRPGNIPNRIANIKGTKVHQYGDDGSNILFPLDVFDQVAEIMQPRKRRQISDAERKRLAEMGFKKRHNAQ